MKPMLRLQNLTKTYGDFRAVDDVNLEVQRGRVFGILGPNGAGKTTTMRMITGLLEPTSGMIEIDGLDLSTHSEEAKQRTGYIPDRPYIYDKLTANEYLEFIGGIYDLDPDKLVERRRSLLEKFNLGRWGDTLIESFSHGMKQRLVFAGAFLPDPGLVIIDEPMVGLDPEGHETAKETFRDMAHEHNKTVLLSTHTLEVAEEICDELVILNHGKIIARGTLGELQVSSGVTDGRLQEVFLALTEENES